MKKTFGVALIIVGGMAVLFAQLPATHIRHQPYDGKRPPAVSLSDAYSLALAALGQDTNQYYCIKTSCTEQLGMLSEAGAHDGQGWTFEFSNTNGVQRQVLVYFDKATWVEPGPEHRGAQF